MDIKILWKYKNTSAVDQNIIKFNKVILQMHTDALIL